MSKKEILLIVGVAIVILAVVIVIGFISKKQCKPASLEMWGLYDEPEIFNEFIQDYIKQDKCVIKIVYKKKSIENYEQELINAFAANQGPDIWMMNNNWLAKHKDKIKELPQDILKFSFADFQNTFVDVTINDLTDNGEIYALPLYVDTLALFYNRDYFNSAGIPYPPETWDDLIVDLDKLTQKNQWGGINRAGIILGTAENINRASDILSLIMLQNGTKMVSDDKKSATINDNITLNGETYYPGQDALRFYTDFSSPGKRNYTWNRQMPYSVDVFADGKSAMMLGYAYHITTLHSKNPYLNYGIAKAPQIEGRNFDVNYANYWAYTVSKQSKASDEAWKFVSYLAGKTINQRYLQKTDRPIARKDLKEWQVQDNPQIAIFAEQSLTARNWYQIDPLPIEKIFSDAIESVVLGSATTARAIGTLNDQLNLLMKP
jgi:ABC-type glycerol-3-phosphate transport system substrate-binding protein